MTMARIGLGRFAALAAWAAVVAGCAPPAAHRPAPAGPPPAVEAALPDPGDLAITHHGPDGEVSSVTAITVVFNQPMVALSTGPAPRPLQVEPPLTGDWRWVSGDTLKLELRGRPRHATEYTVRVPAGTASLAGKRLAQDFVWKFATPRPAVTRVDMPDVRFCGHQVVRPGMGLGVHFNQPVGLDQVRRHLVVSVNGAPAAVTASRETWEAHEYARVTPAVPFPRGAHVAWEMRPGYRGEEGLREARAAASGEFGRAAPFTAIISCSDAEPTGLSDAEHSRPTGPRRCWPMQPGVEVRFSAPVRLQEALRSVQATVTVKGATRRLTADDWEPAGRCVEDRSRTEWTSSVHLKRELSRHARYEVHVPAGITDALGRTSARPQLLKFESAGFPPGLFLPREGTRTDDSESEYVLEAPRRFQVKTVNVRKLVVQSAVLDGPELVRYLECNRKRDDEQDPEAWEGPKDARTRRPCLLRRGVGLKPARREIAVRAATDHVTPQTLPLLRPGRQGGVVAFQVSSPQVVDSERRPLTFERVVSFTGLDVHARLSPHDLVVWVTGLGDGRPVAGAEVRVLDHTGVLRHRGVTGASGVAALPGFIDLPTARGRTEVPRLYVLASKGSDVAYAEPHRHGSDADAVATGARARDATPTEWEGAGPRLVGYAATERGIYRPGETVHVFVIVRQHERGSQRALAGASLGLRVRTPGGAVIATGEVRTDEFGAALWQVELPGGAGLGRYSLDVSAGAAQVARHGFEVQQYRAPRFEVSLHAAHREVLAGEGVDLKLVGRFFSGGPTARAAFKQVVTREPTGLWLPELRGYHVGADLHSGPTAGARGEVTRSGGRLDDKGGAGWRVATKAGDAWHPLRYSVEAEVRDQTQSTVAGEEAFIVHPAARYVAVRRVTAPGAAWDQVKLDLLVVDPKGARQAGSSVTLTVHPRTFDYQRRRTRAHPNVVDTARVLERRAVVVPAAGATVSIAYPLGEPLASVLLTVQDAAGRVARTDVHLTRPARPLRPRPAARPQPEAPEPLTLRFDRECYDPGQTAVITVRRGVRLAAATLFLQRERTFATVPLDVRGPTAEVRFPVTEEHIGGLAAKVVAYPAGPPRAKGAPVLPVGTSGSLCVNDSALDLAVDVTPERRTYRPGQTATVEISVADSKQQGRAAEVVVMAVDESVLRLTRFHLRNPYRSLYHVPGEQITLDELRAYLMPLEIPVEHVDHASIIMGAAGYGSGYGRGSGAGGLGLGNLGTARQQREKARRLFLTTALFRLVRTDAAGRARVTFPLPDNLTEFRIMAVAFDNERRAGTGQAIIATDQPLALVPALPRLARVGDAFHGGVVVYNNDLPAGEARVTLSATGLASDGPTTKTLRVGKGLSEEARFALRTGQQGRARLRFEVTLGGQRDVLEHELQVEPVRTPEARAIAGMTEDAARHAVDPLDDVQPGYGGLEVSLSASALTGVEEGFDQLIRYPYGCMEQKSSQLLPMLGAITLGSRLGVKLPGDPRALSRRVLGDILALQLTNGGFTLWPGGRDDYPWLTAYALVVFHRAAQAGLAVDPENVQQATRYLAGQLRDQRGAELGPLGAQALMVYGLALHGIDVTEPAARLFAARGSLPTFGRAMLLAALGRQARATAPLAPLPAVGRPAREPRRAVPAVAPRPAAAPPPAVAQMVATLAREVGNALAFEGGYAWAAEAHGERLAAFMSSNDRTTAMVLLALLQARPDHPAVPRLAHYLVSGRRDAAKQPVARFRNTQEAAWSLMALGDYAAIIEGAPPNYTATVSLGRQALLSERFAGAAAAARSRAVPMAALQAAVGRASQQLLFRKQGSGRLYYSARLRYARRDPAAAPVSRGFTVARRLVLLDEAGEVAAEQRTPRLGDVVLVQAIVRTTQSRRFVVVDDALPAGLEAIDSSLATASRRATRVADAGRPRSPYQHRELRDDRVVHFIDTLPPGEHVYEYLGRVVAPGAQAWPAARAEEMYSPEVYGTSGGETFRAR
jgi:hypothetical protein